MVKGGQVMDWPLQVDGWAAVMIIWGLMWHALIRILYILFAFFFLSEAGQSNLKSHDEHNKELFSFDTNHYVTGHTTCYNCIWLFLFFLQELEQITISCTYWWCWVDMYGPNHRPIQLNPNVQMVSQDVAKNNHNFTQISHLY